VQPARRIDDQDIGPARLRSLCGIEAATAVNNAARYINPDASVFPGHSSTIMDKAEKEVARQTR
jgi:hypothetical protein